MAASWANRVREGGPVARDRAARHERFVTPSKPTIPKPSVWPTTSSRLCYRQVGDTAIVREHIAKAAPALHAAGNRRYLALLHSLSGVVLAQGGRIEEATAALRQAERLATAVQALDVLGIICNNQANVALIQHRHEQALTLAEQGTALQEQIGPGRGLAISLATLGQILVQLGQLERAEKVLHRALQVRSQIQFHEIRGAVFDTLAQIALMRGGYESASRLSAKGRRGVRWLRRPDEPVVRVVHSRARSEAGDAPRRDGRSSAARERNRHVGASRRGNPGRADRLRSPAGSRSRDRGPRTHGTRRSTHRRAGNAGRMGRVPSFARRVAWIGRSPFRGVPRHRSKRERIRADRRGLPGRAEPPRSGAAREPCGRALAGRTPVQTGGVALRVTRCGARSRRNSFCGREVATGRAWEIPSSRPSTPMMRSFAGSSTPRLFPSCSATKQRRLFATRCTRTVPWYSSRRRRGRPPHRMDWRGCGADSRYRDARRRPFTWDRLDCVGADGT